MDENDSSAAGWWRWVVGSVHVFRHLLRMLAEESILVEFPLLSATGVLFHAMSPSAVILAVAVAVVNPFRSHAETVALPKHHHHHHQQQPSVQCKLMHPRLLVLFSLITRGILDGISPRQEEARWMICIDGRKPVEGVGNGGHRPRVRRRTGSPGFTSRSRESFPSLWHLSGHHREGIR